MLGLLIAQPLIAEVAWPTVLAILATTPPSLTSTFSILSPVPAIGLAKLGISWSTPLALSATPIARSASTQARPALAAPVYSILTPSMPFACQVVLLDILPTI